MIIFSEDHKKNISTAKMGHSVSNETRRKISDANRGRRHTVEARKKMSLAQKGKPKPVSEAHRLAMMKPKTITQKLRDSWKKRIGRKNPMSEETKKKISLAHQNRSIEFRKKISEARLGDKSHFWKGEKAQYVAKHAKISKLKGRGRKCEHCGTETAKRYEWSNKDHKYSRNPDDYQRLCCSCHYKYDVENGLRGKPMFGKI